MAKLANDGWYCIGQYYRCSGDGKALQVELGSARERVTALESQLAAKVQELFARCGRCCWSSLGQILGGLDAVVGGGRGGVISDAAGTWHV